MVCCMLRYNCQIANWIDMRYQCTDMSKIIKLLSVVFWIRKVRVG